MAHSSPGTTGLPASAGPAPQRGLLPLLIVGNSAMYALYVGVVAVLLALQVEDVGPAMMLLGLVDTILLITIAWCLGQAVMNVYQAASPPSSPTGCRSGRGKSSAAVGLGLPFGSTRGALVVGAAVLFTACGREERLPARAPLPVRSRFAAFARALRDHDFRWAFIGRALP
ncbi:hypothetical protein [Streptomyces yangpuensis]|uniref:hypothetical protein n=1 Tax=Streptomyces yangpuensis TaxID=1648182 RepID=UPI003651CF7E